MEEIRIGSHVLQPHRQLLLDGEHVHLGPRALAILTVLAEARGEVVTKQEMMDAVWPDVTVEENALQVHVTALRKALGEDAGRLHTLRSVGYRLEPGEAPPRGQPHDSVDEPASAPAPSRKRPALLFVALGALLFVAAVALIVVANPFSGGEMRDQAPRALAVLPLQISGDEDFANRSEALTASIAGNLDQLPGIEMASETATKTIADEGLAPSEIAERLGVDHIVEIDVLAAEEQLTAQLRLIEARSSKVVWTGEVSRQKQYAGEFEALILNRISGIVLALQSVADGTVAVPEGIDDRAREAFLRGLALLSGASPDDHPRAMRQMQLAASIEPEFASAHAGIALAMGSGTNYSFNMPLAEFEALQSASIERALELEPDNYLAQLARARVVLDVHGDVAAGLEIASDLLAREEADGRAHVIKALAENYAGNNQVALNHIDRAIAADPFNYTILWHRRRILLNMGDYLGVAQSARDCRIHCWVAASVWWDALSRHGDFFRYVNEIDEIAALYEDERAFNSGIQSPGESIKGHARFLFRGEANPFMDGYPDDGAGSYGINIWTLYVFRYGYVDAGFNIARRSEDFPPAYDILSFLQDDRMTLSPEIRADPRYHAIFEIPRYKAVADYRREQGLTAGLPVFPVRPYGE